MRNLVKHGWIAPTHCDDPLAGDWERYLIAGCIWTLSDFGGNYPWDAPIPPRNLWEKELRDFNDDLEVIESADPELYLHIP